jgi:hypothetical protein
MCTPDRRTGVRPERARSSVEAPSEWDWLCSSDEDELSLSPPSEQRQELPRRTCLESETPASVLALLRQHNNDHLAGEGEKGSSLRAHRSWGHNVNHPFRPAQPLLVDNDCDTDASKDSSKIRCPDDTGYIVLLCIVARAIVRFEVARSGSLGNDGQLRCIP